MRPIVLFAALVAAPLFAQASEAPLDPQLDRARYDGCVRAIATNAKEAEEFAMQWQVRGGGLPARHCHALAQLQQSRFAEAAATLEKAAQAAEAEKSPLVADFRGQAGNAAFLAGNSRAAIAHFTAAITGSGEFSPQRSANLRIDRARAHADLGDLAAARADIDAALPALPNDATLLMLSAALARRQGDLARATTDIARASALAPSDPDIQFEQGNIAAASGDIETAQKVWAMVVRSARGSEAADLAQKALNASR